MTRQITQDARPRRGRPEKQGLQQHLLLHTLQVLLRDGYDKFSMNAVAQSASASKETLYRHFKDKEGLLGAALKYLGGVVEPLILEGVRDSLGKKQRLQLLAENYLKGLLLPESVALQRLAYADSGGYLGREFAGQFTDAALCVMTRQFDEMGTPNPKLDAEVFLAMVQGQVHEKALLGVIGGAQRTRKLREVTTHAVTIFSAYLDR